MTPIAESELRVAFQPIVNLRTGQVYGYEALGRGPRAPGELLDQAAREGWLLRLDFLWRAAAIRAVAGQHANDSLVFFLNVDTRILDDAEFQPGHTRALLDECRLSPGRFVLELSERGEAMASERIRQLSDHYKSQGFRIALDDVGAGYSSLTTIVQARPDVIKLDMELIRGVAADPLRRDLVQAFAEFSRRARMPLIAEGVETRSDLHALSLAGVEWGQGYLLGRPETRALEPTPEVRALVRELGAARSPRAPSLRAVYVGAGGGATGVDAAGAPVPRRVASTADSAASAARQRKPSA